MNTKKVAVAVPKKHYTNVGVLTEDAGIINVEVPPGLRFGDEFELTYAAYPTPHTFKVAQVALPRGLGPGQTFSHRAPNGKIITVMCPPKTNPGDCLLFPWSDSSNPHHLVQARVQPEETNKPYNLEAVVEAARAAALKQKSRKAPKPGFSEDDLSLAQALSLTTLNSHPNADEDAIIRQVLRESIAEAPLKTNASDDDELQLVIRESVREAQARAERFQRGTTSYQQQNNKLSTLTGNQSVDNLARIGGSTKSAEEDELERAINASLKEAEKQASLLKEFEFTCQTSSQSGSTQRKEATMFSGSIAQSGILKIASNGPSQLEDRDHETLTKVQARSLQNVEAPSVAAEDEDEIMRKVIELSIREAEIRSQQTQKNPNLWFS